MRFHYCPDPIVYDGKQLSPHFAYRRFQIPDDSIVAFCGRVQVELSEMVDIEDVLQKAPISSDQMLSFIIECFDLNLYGAVLLQRLFVAIIREELLAMSVSTNRDGDDLFYNGKKLSVSIATVSPVSALIHTALNIVSTGAPIEVSSLSEMGIDPEALARRVGERLVSEWESVRFAKVKVRPVF